jgi:uncharacterized damage-inducible protein DinB
MECQCLKSNHNNKRGNIMKKVKFFSFVLFNCVFLQFAVAQSSTDSNTDIDPFFKDLIGNLNYTENQVESLEQAMPQEKFSWRPMEGVRSVSEVYLHIAGANYYLLSFVGGKMPEGMTEDMDKTITDKDEIVKMLKDSFAYAKDFISKMKKSDLDKEVEFFGNKTTYRGILYVLLGHIHEHLGQSIAYARMNEVVPPWSK